jgi:hypothetical protein
MNMIKILTIYLTLLIIFPVLIFPEILKSNDDQIKLVISKNLLSLSGENNFIPLPLLDTKSFPENSCTDTKPPLKFKKICKEFISGELMGVVFGIFGALIGSKVAEKDDEIYSYGLIGAYSSYIFGNSLGVYATGNDGEEKGPFLAALGGALVGAMIGGCSFYQSDLKGFGIYSLVFAPPIGSIVGFNLFRRAREIDRIAFINYDQGMLKLSLGQVAIHYDRYSKPVFNFHLIQTQF